MAPQPKAPSTGTVGGKDKVKDVPKVHIPSQPTKKKSGMTDKLIYAGVAIGICLLGILLSLSGSGRPSYDFSSSQASIPTSSALANVNALRTGVPSADKVPLPTSTIPFLSSDPTKVPRMAWINFANRFLSHLAPEDRTLQALMHAVAARALPTVITETPFRQGMDKVGLIVYVYICI